MEGDARARGRVSWKHVPGASTPARPRAGPSVQSARGTRELEVCVEQNVGRGSDFFNNVAEFVATLGEVSA